jgi:hypothetical protein
MVVCFWELSVRCGVVCFWDIEANVRVVDGANIEIAEEVSVEASCYLTPTDPFAQVGESNVC